MQAAYTGAAVVTAHCNRSRDPIDRMEKLCPALQH